MYRPFLLTLLLTSLLGTLAYGQPQQGPAGEEVPLWELGFGAGALHVPDYPAASQGRMRGIALPYVIYRGDVLRLGDGQAARAVAAESNLFELSMSFDAAFDATSDNNRLREDMPDLDFLFEAGPQLILKLGDYEFADGGRSDLRLSLQARGVFSTDFTGINHRGYVLEPMLRYRHYGLLWPQLDTTISMRPVWADRRLHGYFYDVGDVFVTDQRPGHRAREGYFGTHLNFYAAWHFTDKFQVFGGIQTMNHNHAANTGSPLHDSYFTTAIGVGFIWSVLESRRTVLRP